MTGTYCALATFNGRRAPLAFVEYELVRQFANLAPQTGLDNAPFMTHHRRVPKLVLDRIFGGRGPLVPLATLDQLLSTQRNQHTDCDYAHFARQNTPAVDRCG